MKVGFLGLGVMGAGMARNLVAAGHDVTVWNRTRAKAEALGERGARIAETPVEAASDAEVLITMLGGDASLAEVLFERGAHLPEVLPAAAVHVAMETISVDYCTTLTDIYDGLGKAFVCAPVIGRALAPRPARWCRSSAASGRRSSAASRCSRR